MHCGADYAAYSTAAIRMFNQTVAPTTGTLSSNTESFTSFEDAMSIALV